jgi:putative peptidoglycan lipid II flippase
VAFLVIGRMLVAALFQTGRFGDDQTIYVWYILAGATVGMLAMTQGRLYSSAFYALRDTKTPLKFAVARVALTGLLGYLFAFPLRWVLIDLILFLGMPIPASIGGAAAMGTAGLTVSAGIAGWLEFLLLRRALQKRIGPVSFPMSLQLTLGASAVSGGAAAVAFDLLLAHRLSLHLPLQHIAEAALVAGVFGVVYFGVAMLGDIPEAKATLGRLVRKPHSSGPKT